jgi:DNA-binding IclR family transcriptional regulator
MSEGVNSTIKSVGRVFEVLELFEKLREPLTSIKVGRHLNYPASSALALLKSMVALGYLSFDRIDRTYFPTVRLTLLGQWVERAVHMGEGSLINMIDEMIKVTGESVSISSQNDLHMQFIHIGQGPQHITVSITAGALAPLFRSSIGLVALTLRPDAEIARLAARHNKSAKTREERVDAAEIIKIVEGIRRRGWFAGYDMYVEGLGAIAFVLPTLDGRRSMVLSVSGLAARIRRNEATIVESVQKLLADYGFVAPARPLRRA